MNRCEMCRKNPLHPDKKCCFNCARSGNDCDVWHNCGEDCPGWDNAIKTNADRIRAMSDEELAQKLLQFNTLEGSVPFCRNLAECEELLYTEDGIPEEKCMGCLLNWLRQPVEVE